MATTSPDTLWSPDPTGNYNLVADWATSMQSVQAALVKRANLYVGTSAQRTAFTTAPEGVHWQDTDGSKLEYVRKAGAWVEPGVSGMPEKVAFGTVTISTSNSAGGTAAVTFPSGRFSVPPQIQLSKQGGGNAKYIPYVVSATSAGASLGIYSGDGSSGTGAVSVGWFAYGS